jgi:hypothetical protein
MKRIHPPLRETLSLLLVGAAGVGCGAPDDGEKSTSRDVANQEESTPMGPQPESTAADDGTATDTDDGTATDTDDGTATDTDDGTATDTDDGTATDTDDGTATETDDDTPAQPPTPSVVDEVAAAPEPVTRCPDLADGAAPVPEPVAMLDAGTPEPPTAAVDPMTDIPGAAYPDCGDAGYPDCIRG